AGGRHQGPHHGAADAALDHLHVPVPEDGQGPAGVEAEDLVVGPAVVRRPRAGRGAAGRRRVVADVRAGDGRRAGGRPRADVRGGVAGRVHRRAGYPVALIGLGPAGNVGRLAGDVVDVRATD